MVGHLPHRPSTIAVRSLDLLGRKSLHRGAQGSRSLFNVFDEFLTLFLTRRTVKTKSTNGERRIAHLGLLRWPPETLAGEVARATQPTNRKRERPLKSNERTKTIERFGNRCCLKV